MAETEAWVIWPSCIPEIDQEAESKWDYSDDDIEFLGGCLDCGHKKEAEYEKVLKAFAEDCVSEETTPAWEFDKFIDLYTKLLEVVQIEYHKFIFYLWWGWVNCDPDKEEDREY